MRDPRELFVAEKLMRARGFAQKHRGRGVVPKIALLLITLSVAAPLSYAALTGTFDKLTAGRVNILAAYV